MLAFAPVAAAQALPAGWSEALGRLGATTGVYFEIAKGSDAVITALTTHLDEAAAHATAETPAADVGRWNERWTADTRAKIIALKLKVTNAPRYSPADARIVVGSEQGLEVARTLNETPAALAKMMDLLGQTVERASLLAPRIAAKDPEAELEMDLELLNMGAAAMKLENVTLTTQMSMLAPSHPQRALFVSSRSLNLAMIELMDAMARTGRGETVDRKAVAAAMKGHVAEAEKAARQIPRASAQMSKDIAEVAVTPALQQATKKAQLALASFDESSKVELRLAKLLSDAADEVGRSDDGLLKAAAALEQLDPLAERRAMLMAERATALAE